MKQTFDFKALLRTAGLKVTVGRVHLLEVLSMQEKPMTVTQLFSSMKKSSDPVTLYRALEVFVEKGLVRRVDLGHSHAHYEFAHLPHHHHLVCTNCSRIEDVEVLMEKKIEQDVLTKSKHFTTINTHALEFFGLCTSCA